MRSSIWGPNRKNPLSPHSRRERPILQPRLRRMAGLNLITIYGLVSSIGDVQRFAKTAEDAD